MALLVASAVGYTIFSSHIRTNNWPRLTVLRCDIKKYLTLFVKANQGMVSLSCYFCFCTEAPAVTQQVISVIKL